MSDAVVMDSAKRVEQTGYVAWGVCLSAGLFFLYEFFQLICFDVINPSLRRDFGLTAVQLSWLSSAYMTANTLFLLPAGWLLDRFSTRIIILAAMSRRFSLPLDLLPRASPSISPAMAARQPRC